MPEPVAPQPTFRRTTLVALSILAAAVVALTLEGFTGRLPGVRDMASATIPSRWFWRESVLGGHLAIWSPFVSLGYPTVASPVHGTFYPLQLLVALLPFRAGFFATWALHALLGGAGGYVLARSCGCRSESALVAGLVWAVGGYTTSMWWNGEKILPTAWIPWVAWGMREVARAPRIFGKPLVVAAGSAALLCAAGDPFLLFDAALLGVAVTMVEASDGDGVRIGRLALASCAVFGLALFLAAPVLLPAAFMSPDTGRGATLSGGDATAWSMSPVRWLELFVPSPLGNPLGDAESYAGAAYADSPAQVQPFAVSMFVGSATLAFASAARGRRVLVPLWGIAVLAVLLALGRHTPVDGWARSVVPGLARSRFSEKHVAVAIAAIALLAARGVEEVLAKERSARRVIGVAIAGLAVAVLFAPAPLRATARLGAVHAVVEIAAIGCALVAARRSAGATWLIPLALAADLVTSSRGLLQWMPASALEAPPLVHGLATAPGEAPRRVLRLQSADFLRVSTLPFNAPALFGLDAVAGWDPAMSPLVELLPSALAGRTDRLLELLRVDAVLVPSDRESMTPTWSMTRIPPRSRAWMVGAVIPTASDAEALKTLGASATDPESVAVVAATETSAEIAALARATPRALGGCEVARYEATRVAFRCKAAAPALVVVPDAAMRGWRATVDGAPAAIVRTDVALRGVAVSPGEHVVEMLFEAPGLTESLLVQLLGLLVCALAMARSRN